MSNDKIFMTKLRKLFYEHPEADEFMFNENGKGILYDKNLKTDEWGKFVCKDIEEPDDWKWGDVLMRDEVLDTPAVVKMLVENDVLRTLLDEQFRSKNWLMFVAFTRYGHLEFHETVPKLDSEGDWLVGSFRQAPVPKPPNWDGSLLISRSDVYTAVAISQNDEWANNAAFLTALRRVFIANPLTEIIVFDPNGRAFGFANMPVRRGDHWRRTSGDGIPIAEIVMPSWFDWTMPMRRADVLNDAGKAQMIDEHAQAFQKMFRNPNLKFATIDAEGVVEGHITPPTLTPNRTWASSAKFELSTTAVSFGWQYYWMVSRSEVDNATTSGKGQIWVVLDEQFVYIHCIDGSLFAFDKAMENAYPLYGLNLPELAGLDDGEIIGRPGHAVWFALASKILSRLAPEYGWVTGGEGYVRIHTQQPIYSPQKGWVSKGYETFGMDVPLDGLAERLAIYGRFTTEVDYER